MYKIYKQITFIKFIILFLQKIKPFSCFWVCFISYYFAPIQNKKTALSYLICKKPVFSLNPGKMLKNSYKINQSQYRVINTCSDYMLHRKNTNDL